MKNRVFLKSNRGFTLIEVMVVLAVVGIMTTVTVPVASVLRDKGQSSATASEIESFEKALSVYGTNGNLPVPDSGDYSEACLSSEDQTPQVCCVAEGDCVYAGTTLKSLSRGAFSKTPNGRLNGAISQFPRLPPRPITSGNLQYKGVFFSCNDSACQKPSVIWTQPNACPTGMTRNTITGLCQRKLITKELIPSGSGGGSGGGMFETFCIDGLDNDNDNLSDCQDSDCVLDPACMSSCSPSSSYESDCSPGSPNDEDCDNYINCGDSDCAWFHSCGGQEINCNDFIDDDMDAYVDCSDSDCFSDPACSS